MPAGGGLLNLLDAYIAIGGDTAGFDAALSGSEAKAKASGDRISSLFTPSKVFAALATVAGAAMGAALTGANQLDAATRRLEADTGMTSAEAAKAEHAMAGMYANNLAGFDQIGDTLGRVINGLHLTGDAANAAATEFLKFQEATGLGASSVDDIRGVLDAWNLSAEDSLTVMDALVASHEQYGTNISEDMALLLRLAPALQAVNMNWQDGVTLLNLFTKAGISVDRIPTAMNTALAKVKTPAEFKQTLIDIGTMPDRFAAAQKASDLFGARVGPAMAQALARTHGDLSSFAIDMDQAAGATDRAAAAVESGFGAQFELLMRKAGGALADFGTQFGPLIMLASVVGPKFLAVLGAGLGGAGALLISKITGPLLGAAGVEAWMTTGTMIGTTIGAAATAAMYLAVPIAIGGILVLARDEWKKQTESWGLGVPDLQNIFNPPVAGVKVPAKPYNVADTYLPGAYDAAQGAVKAASNGLQQGLAAATPQWEKDWQQALTNTFRAGERDPSGDGGRVAADKVAATFGTALVSGVVEAAKHASSAGMAALAQGISDARQAPVDAFNTMLEMLKTPETAAQEAARLAGGLTSHALKDGLESKDPEIHAQAIAVKRMIVDRLEEIAKEGGNLGKDAMAELVKGMNSKDDDIAYASKVAHDAALSYLNQAKTDAATAGENAATAFANGLATLKSKLPSWIVSWLGISGGGPAVPGLATGLPYVPRDMLAVIHQSEAVLTTSQANAWRSGESGTAPREQLINIEHVHLANAHDEFSIAQQLRFLASVG